MDTILFDKENESRPYIAVSAIIYKTIKGKKHILLGKRKNVAGAGKYYMPGGHIHEGERIVEALIREIKEECDIAIRPKRIVWIEENFEKLHHINIYYESDLTDRKQVIKNLEPHKCEGWKWYPVDNPPSPLWLSLGEFLSHKGKNFF